MPPPSPSDRTRVLAPVVTLSTIIIAIVVVARAGLQSRTTTEPAVLAIEHGSPLTLSMVAGSKARSMIVEFSHDGDASVALSLPTQWALREVRGAGLAAVPSDAPQFGFIRWHLPPRVVLGMQARSLPSPLTLHHPSATHMELKLRRINLDTGEVIDETFLIKEGPVRLW
ncbi:MAG: hypothetical protein Greene041619_508 [Candidatus Peregrinibacteria bacterium Greene0416_19]|nr:MAG: hypothetical protein Greene041619_508 [Candidatus Peregrinibacteria bacterium Greene0416_19]